jgi:hypothetical protein
MKKGRYLLLLIGILSSCGNVEISSSNQNSSNTTSEPAGSTVEESSVNTSSEEISDSSTITIENTVETWDILEDTIYETTVYKFTSNIPGPRYAIVGGIHGDEVAGWKAALMLKERRNFEGEVLIIPQASILACKREERYPGRGQAVNGITYKDLNRNFPGNPDGNITKQIAYAISETVKNFNPDVIVDLHESLRSSSSSYFDQDTASRLGDLLIYGNSWTSLFTQSIIEDYNASYLQDGDYPFGTDTYAPGGSFNQYFGGYYEDRIVITIETTRYFDENRPKNEERRIQQQLEMIDLILEFAKDY